MLCPKCRNPIYGPAERIIGAEKHCILCGYTEVPPRVVEKPMTVEQFNRARFPKRAENYETDPCPVVGCHLGIPKGRKLVMCQTCRNMVGRWKKKGSQGDPPLFVNEEGKWERRIK